MARKKPISKATSESILRALSAGGSPTKLAKKYKVAVSTIYRVRRRGGVGETEFRPKPDKAKPKLGTMRDAGIRLQTEIDLEQQYEKGKKRIVKLERVIVDLVLRIRFLEGAE